MYFCAASKIRKMFENLYLIFNLNGANSLILCVYTRAKSHCHFQSIQHNWHKNTIHLVKKETALKNSLIKYMSVFRHLVSLKAISSLFYLIEFLQHGKLIPVISFP
jgi:hypothetical protein